MEKKGDQPKKKNENANTSTNTNSDATSKYKTASGWNYKAAKTLDTEKTQSQGWSSKDSNTEKAKGWGATNSEKVKGWGATNTEKAKGWGTSTTVKTKGWGAKNEAENGWGVWRTNRNTGDGAPVQRPYGRVYVGTRTGYSRYASSSLVTKVGEYNFRAPSHIYFSKPRIRESENLANFLTSPNQSHLLFLLNPVYDLDIFKYIPRLFTIVTNKGSYLFNIEFLKDTSSTIRNYLKGNPEATKYELSCKDDYNIVGKLEQLYLGKMITIDPEESPFFKLITDQLNITGSLKIVRTISPRIQIKREIQPILSNLHAFLRNNFPKTFTIATKNKEYLCNPIGIHSSKVIHEFLSKNPGSNRFEFDFEDESRDFQVICDFFNFNLVQLTTDNMNSAKTIAEDLQIDFIKSNIDSFIEDYENRIQTLDDNQSIVDSIDELFETLFKIKEITVDAAKEKIINSIWCQTEEEVQELAAFFLKVISVDFKLHPYLADLLEALNKEADDSNQLKVLVPFVTKKLMPLLGKSNKFNSFIFILCRKGFIQKEEIKKNLVLITKDIKFAQNNQQQNNRKPASRYGNRSNSNRCLLGSTYSFFIPELYEIFDSNMNKLLQCFPDNIHQFIKSYYPENFENFLKMRESGETDDLFVKSLRNDDIDTFQSIVTQKQMNLNSRFVFSYDLFENMSSNEPSSYINYAAAYGSLKCFKYLLLNHANLDKSSFSYAIFGGNDEIIKIIDQKSSEIQEEDKNKNPTSSYRSSSSTSSKASDVNIIIYAITKHENDLFDWILEHKFPKINEDVKTVTNLLSISSENGNSHAIMTIIDKGFDFMKHNISMCSMLIQKAATNGFYKLLYFLIIIMNKKLETCEGSQLISVFDLQTSFSFGNLSIFKLYYEKVKTMDLKEALIQVVGKGYDSIIEYIFDEHIDKMLIDQDLIEKLLSSSIENQNCDQFNYLISKFDNVYSNPLLSFNYINLLSESCYLANVEISKRIVELIFEQIERNNDEISRIDFTLPFFNAASSESAELCQFLVDKEVYINYKQISLQISELSKMNNDILQIIVKNIDNDTKEIFASLYIKEVIENKNKNFIEYLLNETKVYDDNLLFLAVNTYDLEIVNLILNHNSDPLFVNKISDVGTALNVAVMNQNLPIVKRLLSVPGIDPSLDLNNTPLINAIFNLNIDIINALLDFYGQNINSQTKQINIAFTKFLDKLSKTKSKKQLQTETDIKLNVVLNRLIEIESIDINCTNEKYSLLSYACENDQIDIVKTLIKHKNINLNLRSPEDGSSSLLISIKNKHTEISKILIEQERTNINQPNYSNETPLTASVMLSNIELVEMIINDKRFDPIESNLNYAFFLADDSIAKILITAKGLDVNYRYTTIDKQPNSTSKRKQSSCKMVNLNNNITTNYIQTPLLLAVKKSRIELVDLIINHSSFDPSKSMVNECIFIACDKQDSDIFAKLLKLTNINIVDEFGCSLLENAVNSGLTSTVTEILNNETFNLSKNYFMKAFILSFTSKFSSLEIIKELIEYDSKHNHYIDFKKGLPDGRSYFTILSQNSLKIYQIVKFLIENGADPNQPDRSGIYPLEFAIKTSRLNFINALIDSGKVNFNTKLYKDQKSYLHIAASNSKCEIISIFLKNKLIDINVTDSDGNTPLINACKSLNDQVIKILFDQDDLDYLHVNNNGEDALIITKKLFHKQEESNEASNELSKIEYRDALIELITRKGRTVNKTWPGARKGNNNESEDSKDEKNKENKKGDAEKEDNEKSSNENETDDHNKTENKEDNEKSNDENENKENEKIDDEDENNKEKSNDENENKDKEKSDDEDESKGKSDNEDEKSKSSNEFTPKVGFTKANQIPATNKYKFGFKKSTTSDSKPSSSSDTLNTNQQNDTKPSFGLQKRDLPSTLNPPQSRFTKTTPNSPVEDQIVSAVCESLHLESVTPEQAKEISTRLSMIAGIEKNNNSHQSVSEEKKQQKRIKINLENVDEDENEVIRSQTNQLNRRRNEEIDLYNDYSAYQNQMFQSQWNQVMQLNNMRNAQFSMIMQQQQQMMGMFGNVNLSKSQSKKKKKKSNK